MNSKYRFSFGYLALKMLGKTLYSNPFAALSELIANGFDANANNIWIYLDIIDKRNSEIIIIDNGTGMSDVNVITKYLQVGKDNREINDNEMMGRKGIGKLAAFYLSNNYYIFTKTSQEENVYEISFIEHENGTKNVDDDNYMRRIEKNNFINKVIYDNCSTGTALVLKNVNFTGYGEKSFSVLEGQLAELFSFDGDKKIFLKIVTSLEEVDNSFVEVKKRIAFNNMSKILYNIDDKKFDKVKLLDGNNLANGENKSSETVTKISVEYNHRVPRLAIVGGKEIQINPRGWIGIHHTIDRAKAHKNDVDNFINSRFYHFNKVRIYVRGKLALENILPDIHNTQFYVNYIEGDIHCDELDSNDFPDIAASSRQAFDKNDDRVIALTDYVNELVKELVNFKNIQTNNDLKRHKTKQSNAVKDLGDDVTTTLKKKIGKIIELSDVEEIQHSIINSFEKVNDLVKTKYFLFLSHRRTDKYISDFIYYYLITACGFDDNLIFYTSKDGGINESVETLEKQINETLTSKNSYVVFCIGSKGFKKSEYCMFEGGAAWAVKQKDIIGLVYNNYDKNVPDYLKRMQNFQIDFSVTILNRNLYISIVNLLNSIIEYLNRNYVEDSNKKSVIKEILIPNKLELTRQNKTAEDFYNKDVVEYWNYYVINY